MSHAEASENLRLVEEALDKVVPGDNSAAKNFTGRLIGTITRTVKYVADVSFHPWDNITWDSRFLI